METKPQKREHSLESTNMKHQEDTLAWKHKCTHNSIHFNASFIWTTKVRFQRWYYFKSKPSVVNMGDSSCSVLRSIFIVCICPRFVHFLHACTTFHFVMYIGGSVSTLAACPSILLCTWEGRSASHKISYQNKAGHLFDVRYLCIQPQFICLNRVFLTLDQSVAVQLACKLQSTD